MSDDQDCIWIKTTPAIDHGGSYVVTIEFSDDRALTLNKGAAMEYASTVLAAAQRAEHDAAVFAQMSRLIDFEQVAAFIRDLRKDRPPLDYTPLGPMRLDPGVNNEGEPFLALFLDDVQRGQWTVADAREHAMFVVETVEAADLDSAYYRALVGLIGVEPGRAHNVVNDLANYRPGANS